MKQQKRLRTITWLMLISEVLLLLFVGEWLRSQYHRQKEALHHDLQAIFIHTGDQLTDAALDHVVMSILRTDPKTSETHVTVNYTGADTMLLSNDTFKTMLPLLEGHKVSGNSVVWRQYSDTSFRNITIQRMPDSQKLPEQLTKALRIAVVQTANAQVLHDKNFSLPFDSNALKQHFTDALRKKAFPFEVDWNKAAALSDSMFHYRMPGKMLYTAIGVKGYQGYLLRSMLPQILFSIVLLLLTGLAFWLAYRNMKRQKEFSEQKDSFISNVSHELKTPVATTKVALEALSNFNAMEDPVRSAKYLRMATWEMERLETMINRVMNTIQAEQGQMSLYKEELDLGALLEEITDRLQPLFQERGITVRWEHPQAATRVHADRAHLQGTLYNLLDNAAKYGGDTILIQLSSNRNEVLLKIADNGKGIPQAYHKKVFERFFRIPSGNEHSVKGHGLGLSYARFIIQAHGGNLWLEDQPGGGVVFIISLPAIQ